MNEEKIIEGNRLINTFEKGELLDEGGNRYYEGLDKFQHESGKYLKYHTSWDWQIPVWSKIAKASKNILHKLEFTEYEASKYFSKCSEYERAIFNNRPEDGQVVIIEMINWYNQQNK